MFDLIGALLNGLFDILLLPFRFLPQFWGLLFLSLLSGIGMISVFRLVSNQEKISVLRRRMGGEVFGILLHVSNPGTVIKFAFKLIWSNTVYLGYILIPLLVLALPFMLVWGQLEARFGSGGLDADYPTTVTLYYEDGIPSMDDILIGTVGLELVPPLMVVDTLKEISFRVLPAGDSLRSIELNGTSFRMGRTADWNGCRILKGFRSDGSLNRLFSPWTGRIGRSLNAPSAGWYSIQDIRYRILGGYWSWIAVFLVFSTLSAIVGAKLFKVRI